MPSEEDIYQEHILDHYEDPFHRGDLPTATHAHEDKNPLCGDVVRIQLQLDDDGKIADLWFEGSGCVISQASASMLLEKLEGKTVDNVREFSASDMLELFGAKLTPNRQKCCLLSWRVVQQAIHSPIGV
jgi:nitrogen fixation protein NifU and related proteins